MMIWMVSQHHPQNSVSNLFGTGHPVEFLLIYGDFQERKNGIEAASVLSCALRWLINGSNWGGGQVAGCRQVRPVQSLQPSYPRSPILQLIAPNFRLLPILPPLMDRWLISAFQGQSNRSLKLLDFVWAENLKNSSLLCLDGALLIALSKQISLGCAGIDREAVPRQTRVLRGMMDEVFQAAGGCSARQRLRLPLPATLHIKAIFSKKIFYANSHPPKHF